MSQLYSIALIEADDLWKFLLIWLVLTWRVVMDRCDRGRIREHIARGGGKVVDISWSPFGRGWFGEGSDRIYEGTYTARDGKAITATCKTSMTTGVFWSSENPPSGFSSGHIACPFKQGAHRAGGETGEDGAIGQDRGTVADGRKEHGEPRVGSAGKSVAKGQEADETL